MMSLYNLLDTVLYLYSLLVIGRIVLDWLVIFGVINRRNIFVDRVGRFFHAITEPVFGFIHRTLGRFVPLQVASVDLVPLVVLLCIYFMRSLLREYLYIYL